MDWVALFLCVLANGWGVQAFYIHGDDDSAAVGYRLLNHYADGEAPDQFTEADSTIRCVTASLSLSKRCVSVSVSLTLPFSVSLSLCPCLTVLLSVCAYYM